jgi:hypothetical protein
VTRDRQRELHKSKILLRCWSHTWQKKATKKNQNSNTLNPQPVQSYSTPCYTEKTRELPHRQMPAPNLHGRCRPRGWLVGHRADLWNLRTSHTLLREELTKQLPLKDWKKHWQVSPTTWQD